MLELISDKLRSICFIVILIRFAHEPLDDALFHLLDGHKAQILLLIIHKLHLGVGLLFGLYLLLVILLFGDYGHRVSRVDVAVGEYVDSLVQFLDVQLENARETLTVSLLDLLRSAETLEPAIDLDGHFGAKGLCFFHGVCGHDECGILSLAANGFPESSPRVGVNSCRGFVKHD